MKLGIQDIVHDSFSLKQSRNIFRSSNISSSNQNWLSHLMIKLNVFLYKLPLSLLIKVNFIIQIHSTNSSIGRDNHYLKFVDLAKFLPFCRGSSCHTRKFLVLLKEVLISDSSHSLRLSLNLNSFFCFNCLMKSFWKSSSWHCSSGMLIYNQNLSIWDNIILIFDIYRFCFQCIFDMMDFSISHIFINIFYFQERLKLCNSLSRKLSCLGFLIDVVISIFLMLYSIFIVEDFLNKSFWNLLFTWTRH